MGPAGARAEDVRAMRAALLDIVRCCPDPRAGAPRCARAAGEERCEKAGSGYAIVPTQGANISLAASFGRSAH
eukprot:3289385-Pyramimonas_sp.AAC.1